MKKSNVIGFINSVGTKIVKHSPEIMTAIGIAGMVSTTILAVKATPKALDIIEQKKEELEVDDLNALEVTKATWKCYIPAAMTCMFATACLIGASSVNVKRNAALATAYKLSEQALLEYRDAVVETIGEKKEIAVRDKIAENRLEKDPVSKAEVFITDKGESLCYDALSGRYFKCSYDTVKKAENQLNNQIMCDDYASLNDFYGYLGLEYTKTGDEIGWKVTGKLVEIDISARVADDGTPCLVLNYSRPPEYKFNYYG